MSDRRGGRPIRSDSVRGRMLQFFIDNPDEELTYEIARVKFACSKSAVEHAIKALRETGVVEAVHVIRNRAKGIAK